VFEFRILGPLEVVGEDGPVPLGGPKQRATLAILLLNANRVVSIDRLADQLYAGRAPVTAATQVHRQISELRKALGERARLETRSPGYVIHVAPEQLDLNRFEQLTEQAGRALERGEVQAALDLQREGLALWRGPVLADLDHEPFAQVAIARLRELQLAAVEQRLDAELALGRHREIVGELEELAADNPVHEAVAARLMLALYRSGRQAEALEIYRRTRQTLVDDFGIEPGRELHELEREILNHDTSLDVNRAVARPPVTHHQIVLVLPSTDERTDDLLTIAEPLALLPGRELLIARLLPDESPLSTTVAALNARRASLGVDARTAAFTSRAPADDAEIQATAYDVRLILLDSADLDAPALPDEIASIVDRSPADVGLLTGPAADWSRGDGVCVPFGGGEHDWAALEVGAWLASSREAPLRLVGARADGSGRRDASRLLADAAMSVQRALGVDAVPQLIDPDPDALVEAVAPATIVVMGLSANAVRAGLGDTRRAVLRRPGTTLFVHTGLRPSGLAPAASRTRFTWTIEVAAS
jgi:DNA-binding SARP family transcriptional activator